MSRNQTKRSSGLKKAGSAIMSHKQFGANARKMKSNTSMAATILTNMESAIQNLQREIDADNKGLQDFDQQLYLLKKEKDGLERNVKKNAKFVADFDKMIGPFSDKYTEMTKEMATLYGDAKKHHRNGVMLLVKEFDYHPLFKRRDDEFAASPFMPK